MKTIYKYIMMMVFAFGMFACADLELENPNQATEASFWKTEADLFQGVVSVYDQLQDGGLYGVDQRLVMTLLSDEGTNEAPWEFFDLARFTLGDLSLGEGNWSANYELIGRAYQVIDRAPDISGSQVDRILAEAQFLAALGYYNLLASFGDNIAYVDGIQNAADRPRRAADGEIWALTIELLEEAIPNLPSASSISTSEYGRISSGAAQALLGKVHMQMGNPGLAEQLFASVVNSGAYSLNDDYEDNFVETNNVNPEAVFHVNFLHNGVEAETDNAIAFKLSSLGEAQSAYGDLQSQNFVRDSFLEELDADGEQDPRMNATVFWEGTDRLYYGQTHAWWMENAEVFNSDVNTAFMKYSEQDEVNANEDTPGQAQQRNGGTDFIVIRYADVLLMYAEALNANGNTSQAYDYVDEVRERSNMNPLSDVAPGLSQAEFLEQLKHERLVELANEGVRFFDLKRWGDYSTNAAEPFTIPAVGATVERDTNFETFQSGQDERFPIPQSELDLNENLIQNPGY